MQDGKSEEDVKIYMFETLWRKDGLQRGGHQREKKHVKDAFCIECQDITKNLEVRYCDSFDEMMQKAEELHREYYSEKVS